MDFCTWDANHTSGALKVRSVCLPGRAHRHSEPSLSSVSECARQLANVIGRHAVATGLPFVLYGQSYGALLAFETALRLSDKAKALLAGVAVASRMPPSVVVPAGEARLSDIADGRAFIEAVASKYGDDSLTSSGVAAKIGTDEESSVMPFVQRLRADILAYENYSGSFTRLPCPVFACRGQKDATTTDEGLQGWVRDYGKGSCSIAKTYDGGHFFTRDEKIAHAVMEDVEKFVMQCIAEKPASKPAPPPPAVVTPISQEDEFLMCF